MLDETTTEPSATEPLTAEEPLLPVADVPDSVDVPITATEAARQQASGVYWIFTIFGITFLVAGWLLPWFVELTSNGVGYSAQDAFTNLLSGAPSGVGSFIVLIMGLAMLALIVGAIADGVALRLGRGTAFRFERIRALVALVGAVCPPLIWLLIGVGREEPLFGSLSSHASADNAIWMMLTGFLALAVATGLRPLMERRGELIFAVAFLLFGALFPVIFSNAQATELIVWAAQSAAIYTLLGLGLNVVVGFAGLLDLGYAAFFAIGAYTAASLASPKHGLSLPFWVIIFLAAAVAALFGGILGAPTLRLRGDYLAIVTLGFGEIIPDAANNDIAHFTGGPNGITGIHHPTFFSYDFGLNAKPYFWTLLVVITVVVLLLRNLQTSRLGRAWVAIREDEIAAAATGINTVVTKLLAFSIGASVSGLAGAFFGAQLGSISPETFGFQVSVTALSIVVLGGIGTNTGAAVGGVVISFIIGWVLVHLREWTGTLSTTDPYTSIPGVSNLGTIDYSKYTYIVYGLILIGIMLLRPAGLIPNRARKVELETGVESASLAVVEGRA